MLTFREQLYPNEFFTTEQTNFEVECQNIKCTFEKKTPIVFSDSKARYLQNSVEQGIEHNIVWWYASGATSWQQYNYLTANLDQELNRHNSIVLFVWLGTFGENGPAT